MFQTLLYPCLLNDITNIVSKLLNPTLLYYKEYTSYDFIQFIVKTQGQGQGQEWRETLMKRKMF